MNRWILLLIFIVGITKANLAFSLDYNNPQCYTDLLAGFNRMIAETRQRLKREHQDLMRQLNKDQEKKQSSVDAEQAPQDYLVICSMFKSSEHQQIYVGDSLMKGHRIKGTLFKLFPWGRRDGNGREIISAHDYAFLLEPKEVREIVNACREKEGFDHGVISFVINDTRTNENFKVYTDVDGERINVSTNEGLKKIMGPTFE